jgi:hypothetical protein
MLLWSRETIQPGELNHEAEDVDGRSFPGQYLPFVPAQLFVVGLVADKMYAPISTFRGTIG